jgi:hypothetical protein
MTGIELQAARVVLTALTGGRWAAAKALTAAGFDTNDLDNTISQLKIAITELERK